MNPRQKISAAIVPGENRIVDRAILCRRRDPETRAERERMRIEEKEREREERKISLNYVSRDGYAAAGGGCPRYNESMSRPKGHRGIKESFRDVESRGSFGSSEMEATRFRSFHARHVAPSFCSAGSRGASLRVRVCVCMRASRSVRNHCSSLQRGAPGPSTATTVHVPSVSRLYVACVLRQPKASARVCRELRDVDAPPSQELPSWYDVPGMETSCAANLKSRSLVNVAHARG